MQNKVMSPIRDRIAKVVYVHADDRSAVVVTYKGNNALQATAFLQLQAPHYDGYSPSPVTLRAMAEMGLDAEEVKKMAESCATWHQVHERLVRMVDLLPIPRQVLYRDHDRYADRKRVFGLVPDRSKEAKAPHEVQLAAIKPKIKTPHESIYGDGTAAGSAVAARVAALNGHAPDQPDLADRIERAIEICRAALTELEGIKAVISAGKAVVEREPDTEPSYADRMDSWLAHLEG